MKGLIKEGTRPYSYQRVIPERFRDRFEGKKKFSVSLDTHEHDEAVRRASVAARRKKSDAAIYFFDLSRGASKPSNH